MAERKAEKVVELFCDGASRGNPGPAAYGFVIYENGEIIAEVGERMGTTTNNVAEYQGLVEGLKKCVALGVTQLSVKSDSELMVRQLNGIYKVKAPQLQPLFAEAKELLKNFKKVDIFHVRRELNKKADSLCNDALDRRD